MHYLDAISFRSRVYYYLDRRSSILFFFVLPIYLLTILFDFFFTSSSLFSTRIYIYDRGHITTSFHFLSLVDASTIRISLNGMCFDYFYIILLDE